MFGIVLWCDQRVSKAVIWCEDHGDLALYQCDHGLDMDRCPCSQTPITPGDLVQFELIEEAQVRYAHKPVLVSHQQYSALVKELPALAKAATVRPSAEVIPIRERQKAYATA